MIEQEDIKTIVMLCNIEKGFAGCSQYFPSMDGETQTHGDFRLSNVNTEISSHEDLALRDIELQGLSGKKSQFDQLLSPYKSYFIFKVKRKVSSTCISNSGLTTRWWRIFPTLSNLLKPFISSTMVTGLSWFTAAGELGGVEPSQQFILSTTCSKLPLRNRMTLF